MKDWMKNISHCHPKQILTIMTAFLTSKLVTFDFVPSNRERSLLYKSKGKYHVTSTSQKSSLTSF